MNPQAPKPLVEDLDVSNLSQALVGKSIDIVVSGSIGAVQTVKFVRALRRLGAETFVWLTEGGQQFITETALEWASGHPVRTRFSGLETHTQTRDACILAPASANTICKASNGISDGPATTLVQSYLGRKMPVLVVPNMHRSLWDAPATQRASDDLKSGGVQFMSARQEEDKLKFPDEAWLANECAHWINRPANPKKVLVTMGATQGFFDDIRYVSNYSSGKLGTMMAEEAYRHGFHTTVFCGHCPYRPTAYSTLQETAEFASLEAALKDVGTDAIIFAASVLDYIPKERTAGKHRSGAASWDIHLTPTEKLIEKVTPAKPCKVGFKLEPNKIGWPDIYKRYKSQYDLSMLVINAKDDVDSHRHKATLYSEEASVEIDGKQELANAVVQHVRDRLL